MVVAIGLALITPSAATAGQPPHPVPTIGVRDNARMFSAGAVRTADQALSAILRDQRLQVVIETVDSLKGRPIDGLAVAHARELQVRGLYILIAKRDRKLWVEPSKSARSASPTPQ